MRAFGHLVITAGHFDLFASAQVEERQINRAAAIVARALFRIGDELSLFRRRRVPEDFGHRPRAITVEDQQAITFFAQLAVSANQGFGSGTLQKGAGFFVNGATEEIVRRGVTDFEFDRRVELDQFDQLWLAKIALLFGWYLRNG